MNGTFEPHPGQMRETQAAQDAAPRHAGTKTPQKSPTTRPATSPLSRPPLRGESPLFHWHAIDASHLRHDAGVYAIFHLNELVYIGSALNLRERVHEHHIGQRWPSKFTRFGPTKALTIRIAYARRPGDHLRREFRLIARLKPPFNTTGTSRPRTPRRPTRSLAAMLALTTAAILGCKDHLDQPARSLSTASMTAADVRDHLQSEAKDLHLQTSRIRPDVADRPQIPPRLDAIDDDASDLLILSHSLDNAAASIHAAEQHDAEDHAAIADLQKQLDEARVERDSSLHAKLGWIIGTFTLLFGASVALVYFGGRKMLVAPVTCAAVIAAALTVRVALDYAVPIALTLGILIIGTVLWYAIQHGGLRRTVKDLHAKLLDSNP